MTLVYDKLWRLLDKKEMTKQDLRDLAGISRASIAKLTKNENVMTDILLKICIALKCDISDIAEIRDEHKFETFNDTQDIYRLNSFFAGIGGFDIGFERHGFETKYLCEINPFCNNVLKKHWPNVKKAMDICKIDIKDIPDAEVWCGGFPCQDISVARGNSVRLGLKGSRSGLFYQFSELIEAKLPEVVIIENVAGLFNSNKGRDFGVILQRMSSLGYAVAWRLFNSRYFGVPQSRPRVYLCCWKNNPIKAMHVMFESVKLPKPENERKAFLTEDTLEYEYPKVPKVAYCLAATSGRHTGTDWSRTYIVCHDGVRRMTPKEYERLQGFPDDWTMVSHVNKNEDELDTLRYTAVGNAVSVPVIEWIAKRIHMQLAQPSVGFSEKDFMQQYVPEFSRVEWNEANLNNIDFSDVRNSYMWEKSGLVWNGRYIGTKLYPMPANPIKSSLKEIVEKNGVSEKYYLTSNAATGILRRVDSQGRKLFPPLRKALEILKNKKI
ncbi:DNA (cytosine-5-)-methyltransferase [Megasphaera stantonii]|uniref:DNA (cytosine-5-)-methyltransferase n=1 Tax=Megasphaera stantonii TaxID=2144175 RepID=UPI0029433E4C|nr:DNA (cytosine-5-)-methyltransferase [Megasphaera stantonii]